MADDESADPRLTPWLAVWGGDSEVGVLSDHRTREEAEAAVRAFLGRHGDNPAVGAWVRREEAEEEPEQPCRFCSGDERAHCCECV